jgi:hypothetical protein
MPPDVADGQLQSIANAAVRFICTARQSAKGAKGGVIAPGRGCSRARFCGNSAIV